MERQVSIISSAEDHLQLVGTYKGVAHAPRGAVLLVHGITSGRHEAGLYTRTAAALAAEGLASLRFDFRAHGDTDGPAEALSIRGEVGDLLGAYDWLKREVPPETPLYVLAASFGAVSTCYALANQLLTVVKLTLWCPVLSLERTFLAPEMPWGRKNFACENRTEARPGIILVDDHFEVPVTLLDEMREFDPIADLQSLAVPVLTIHGDADTYVPYAVSSEFGAPNADSRFIPVKGAGHGFGRPEEEALIMRETLAWILTKDRSET